MKRKLFPVLFPFALFFAFSCSDMTDIPDNENDDRIDVAPKPYSASGAGESVLDQIVSGTSAADTIETATGNDFINGLGGGDILTGGYGHDVIYGGDGNDIIYGDLNITIINGPGGNDLLVGGAGNDKLYAGRADSSVRFEGRNYNQMQGQEGNDQFYGGPDMDVITPGPGDDKIYPGDGDDQVILRPGDGLNNRVFLDGGNDWIHLILDEPYMDRDATRVYVSPQNVSGTKTIWVQIDNTQVPNTTPDYTYTVSYAYYDSSRSTNYYIKVNNKVKFIVTVKEYYSNPASHWVEFQFD